MIGILSLSGGLDSTTLLAVMLSSKKYSKVIPVQFVYDSKHNPYEVEAVDAIVKHYGLEKDLIRVNVSGAFASVKSALLTSGAAIPEGHYNEDVMKQTVVPGRNLIFASVCAAVAESTAVEHNTQAYICLGVHAGDHHIYPDCRPSFVQALDNVIHQSTEGRVFVSTPFLHLSKAEIIEAGARLEVPYNLTRTCYKAQGNACGVCGSCRERLEAFQLNNLEDPIIYGN